MKKCKICGNKSHIVKSPLGYFGECSKNGHLHNIGVFDGAKYFCKTEKEAEKEWDKYNKPFRLDTHPQRNYNF